MMNILSFNADDDYIDVASQFNGSVQSEHVTVGREHSKYLVSEVTKFLSVIGRKISDYDSFATLGGPGSFTSLRICLSVAKGFSFATGIPIRLVPSLEALAHSVTDSGSLIVPVIDARRERFYSAAFALGSRVAPDGDRTTSEIVDMIGQSSKQSKVVFCGPGARLVKEVLPFNANVEYSFLLDVPNTAQICLEIADRFAPASDDSGPKYIRPTDAEEREIERTRAPQKE